VHILLLWGDRYVLKISDVTTIANDCNQFVSLLSLFGADSFVLARKGRQLSFCVHNEDKTSTVPKQHAMKACRYLEVELQAFWNWFIDGGE
jgi:hypothetical protein